MSSEDVIDDVNTLLKLGVGDPYRLEHIKQAYIENKTIWITDKNYLKHLKAKYITKIHSDVETGTGKNLENDSEDKELIHCWKCGKKGPLKANFCMVCGTSLFEVGKDSQSREKQFKSKRNTKPINLKMPIIIIIPVLVVIILGAGYIQGSFDNILERQVIEKTTEKKDDTKDSTNNQISPTGNNSKCGAGTIFDEDTNSCVLEKGTLSTGGN
ncbi:MAG TPA: zinc ribbon domain-containing protein, partial [Nitrosopumilus sp.]|nr:zinc ribbon domain-containing protein [Nitrosopumilus sp.]